jgi:acetoacetyl-CoA reductase
VSAIKIPEEVQENIRKTIRLGRFGKPEDIASAVRYIVEEGDYMTGDILDANGGIYM